MSHFAWFLIAVASLLVLCGVYGLFLTGVRALFPATPSTPVNSADPPRAIGRAAVPLNACAQREREIAELTAIYALPDYHRPPSAIADSYLDPGDLQ